MTVNIVPYAPGRVLEHIREQAFPLGIESPPGARNRKYPTGIGNFPADEIWHRKAGL